MREIKVMAQIISNPPEIVECPICKCPISHFDPMPRLKIDFDAIAKQLDLMTERFPSYEGDVVKIIITLAENTQDMIYGHPVEYQVITKESVKL